jgi:multidrug efflux pump subunit AcrA (membrane-fusion protein)
MHPDYHSDNPGDCPICGMRLVLAEKKDGEQAGPEPGKADSARPAERRVLFYRHPMNPSVTSPMPAKDEMGMDYVPVYAGEAKGATGGISGMASVETAGEGFRLAGVQTAVAERQSLSRTTRAAGVVVADETRVRHVHTKVAGYIEKLYVNYTGQQVRRGQPLLSIYSPELLATQRELLRAKEVAERFSGSALPEVRRGGEELLEAVRQRLELLDVPPGFISRLESTGQAQRTVTLTAPASGFVTGKEIFEGQEVQPGMDVLTLTDLSRVWIEADFYEYESRSLRLGEKATVSLPYDSGVRLTGRVAFVYPVLDPQTRTIKVRLEFPNPGLALKPGMYVDVTPELETAEGVVIPGSAILDTGVRQVVFVEKGGAFVPREVRVGSRDGGRALVLSGVEAGERVAVRANFLLDSESRLRAAVAAVAAVPPASSQERGDQ